MNMKTKRIILSVLGVLTSGVSVGIFKLAAFGVDPFQSLMSGLDALIPISFGTLYVIVNALLLLFALAFDRHYISIATFINLFLLGYVVEFSHGVLLSLFPAASVGVRVAALIIGFVILCFGSSMYIMADMGVSTYDAIALVMTHKWKLGKFKYIRILTDLACILLGIGFYLLSGGHASQIVTFVGIGTIMTAFFMGPLIDVFNRIFEPILQD